MSGKTSVLAKRIVGKTVKRVALSCANDDYQPQIELWFTDGSYFCAMRELKTNPEVSVCFTPSDNDELVDETVRLKHEPL